MGLLRSLCLAVGLMISAPALAQPAPPASLDFLAGAWMLFDATGAEIGASRIEVQAPGAMLFERRTVGASAAQPIWFENSESAGGWSQLFLAASGQIRAFPTQSAPGVWPIVMGADTTLRDGARVRFRLTMSRASDNETRRVLEMSRDQGGSWTTVFDYIYRRAED